jgi:dephospho-CoA kinase
MILILSGGIGSGKSVAAGMLNEMYGFPVYSADQRVKELYVEHPSLLSNIEKELGCDIRDNDGRLIPAALAQVIFSNREALEKVESLVFPALKKDFELWMMAHPSSVHILESATILEKEFFKGFGDFALVVTAPFELRLSRAIQRDRADENAVKARMSAQKMMNDMSTLMQNCQLEFEVCMNDGTPDDLRSKLRNFVENRLLTKML